VLKDDTRSTRNADVVRISRSRASLVLRKLLVLGLAVSSTQVSGQQAHQINENVEGFNAGGFSTSNAAVVVILIAIDCGLSAPALSWT
jgi:hypothetical protein